MMPPMTPDCYTTRFDDAAAFAIAAFRQTSRKVSNVPYITHLFAVCALVGEYGGDEDQLIAALLHDWLEDIPGAVPETLVERYGERVARLVGALSDSSAPPPGEQKPPWQQRKDHYLAHLRDAPDEVKLVSCADKLHNCQTIRADHSRIGNEVFERFTAKREGTLWYYKAVHEALAAGWQSPLLDRLGREVNDLIEAAARQRVEVTGCQTGCQRFPGLSERVHAAGGKWTTVECFDRCEQCERALIARVDGSLMHFGSADDLIEAVNLLGSG